MGLMLYDKNSDTIYKSGVQTSSSGKLSLTKTNEDADSRAVNIRRSNDAQKKYADLSKQAADALTPQKPAGKASFLDTLKSVLSGGAKQWAAGQSDTMRTAYEAGQKGRDRQNNEYLADYQRNLDRAKREYDLAIADGNTGFAAIAKNEIEYYQRLVDGMSKVVNEQVQQKATKATADLVDTLNASSQADIEKAKEGRGKVGKILIDAGSSMEQVLMDAAATAGMGLAGGNVKGLSAKMIPLASRAFGGGAIQARQNGGTIGQQIATGAASSAKEVATELMFGIALPQSKLYGGGALDDVVENGITKFINKLDMSKTGKNIIQHLAQAGVGASGEGLEEFIGDWIEWQFPRIYNGDVDSAGEVLSNSLYDFAVGGASGLLGEVAFMPIRAADNAAARNKAYKEVYGASAGDLADEALDIDPTNKTAQRVKEAVDSGKNVSGSNIRRLVTENDQAFLQEKSAEFGKTAEYFLRNKPEGASAADYYAAYKAVYDMGKEFAGSEQGFETVKASIKGTVLSEELADLAYKAGAVETENTMKEEAKNEGGSRSQEWDNGLDGQLQSEGVARRTAVLERTEQGSAAVEIRNAVENAGVEAQSAVNLGISSAAADSTVRVVPENLYTEEMQSIIKKNADNGVDTTYVIGNITLNGGGEARAAISDDRKHIWLRADHDTFNLTQLNDHENFHRLVTLDSGLINRTLEKIEKKYGTGLDAVITAYANAYEKVGISGDEVLEEMLADAYAGMDIFGNELSTNEAYGGATKFTEEAITSAVESYNMRNVLAKNGAMADNRFSREVDREFQVKFSGRVITANGIRISKSEIAKISSALKSGYGHINEDGYAGSVNTYEKCYLFDVIDDTVSIYDSLTHEELNIHTRDFEEGYDAEEFDGGTGKGTGLARSRAGNSSQRDADGTQGAARGGDAGLAEGKRNGNDTRDLRKGEGNREVKHSREVDSTGKQLTEQQAGYFKDSKVRDKDGNLLVMYRGDNNGDFTVFDRKKSAYSNLYGRGFYFTSEKTRAETYGKAKDFYLNITDPLMVDSHRISKDQFAKFVNAVAEDEDYGIDNYGYDATVESVVNSVFGKGDYEAIMDINAACIGDLVAAVELFNETAGTSYDGIILPGETVAFRSEQIKNTSNETPTNNPDIRYSRDVSAAEADENVKKAEDYFGTTYKIKEAGYLLRDGKLLDFSGKHDGAPGGYRTVDHRDITDAMDDGYDNGEYSGGMVQFMREGNIRLMPEIGGINLQRKPNQEQVRALDRYISSFRGEVIVDFDDENGKTIDSVEYPHGTYSKKVLWGIEDYYDKGIVPTNDTERYSRDLQVDLRKENEKLRDQVEKLTERKEYFKAQGQRTGHKVHPQIIQHLAGQYVKNTTLDAEDITAELQSLGDFMHSQQKKDGLYQDAKDRALSIAEKLVQNAQEIVNPDEVAMLKELRKSLRDSPVSVSDEIRKDFVDWSDWRRRNSYIVMKNGATPVDVRYEELRDTFGEYYFPSDIINPADQLRQIAKAAELMGAKYENPNSYYMAEATEIMANQILRDMVLPTRTDRLISNIKLKAKASQQKAVSNVRAQRDEKIAKLKEQEKAKRSAAVASERTTWENRVSNMLKKQQAQKERAADSAERRQIKTQIKKSVKNLNSLLAHGSKKKNIKQGQQDFVASVLSTADVLFSSMSNADILRAGVQTATEAESRRLNLYADLLAQRDAAQGKLDALYKNMQNDNSAAIEAAEKDVDRIDNKIRALDSELRDVFSRERARLMRSSVSNAISELASAYHATSEASEDYIKSAYNPAMYDRIVALGEQLNGKTVNDMSVADLQAVADVFKMTEHMVRNAGKLFMQGKTADLQETAGKVMQEISAGKKHDSRIVAFDGIKNAAFAEMKPVYAFRTIGSDTFTALYEDARNGEDVWARDIDYAGKYLFKVTKEAGYNKWDFDKVTYFELERGETFTLNLGQIMSIYAYSRRDQAIDHMMTGGFVFASTERVKGKMGVEKALTSDHAFKLTVGDLQQIVASLTPEQAKYVEKMQWFLSHVCSKWGNEVSNRLYGIDLFTEEYYFPLKSSHDFLFEANMPNGQVSLVNSGMTKEVTPGAKNPIVLQGFDEVWGDHVNKMSLYHGLALPIENLNKVYNYSEYLDDQTDSVSVKSLLKSRFNGEQANRYIETFIKDLNGGVRTSDELNPLVGLIGKFKKTAVFASASVVVQQPTAVLRAMALIDPAYFVGQRFKLTHEQAWEQLKKYAPVAIIKEMGGFDTSAGRSGKNWLMSHTYKTAGEKAKAVVTDNEYRDDVLSRGAAYADEIGWISIWNAVKRETRAKMNLSGEAFYEHCGKRFTEIVTQTQVYDSTFSRSGLMRSQSDVVKMATAFMGEPTTTVNMITDAIIQSKRGKLTRAHAGRIVGVCLAANFFASVFKSMVTALRDDDKDKSLIEKYMKTLGGNLADDALLINMLPFVRDIVSIFQGWDVSRSDMEIITDIKNAIDALDSTSKSAYRKTEDFAGAIAALFGLPVKNIMRDFRGLYNFVIGVTDENEVDSINGIVNAFWNGVDGKELKGYSEYGYPYNIDRGTYKKFINTVKTISGEDKDGDGKTDSGSKKANVLEFINTLPLSKEQKDALYYQQGYSQKTISDAPWN